MFNVARQVSFNGLIAIGMTFVIITGGIDLSVGSIFAFASVFSSYVQTLPLPLMFIITLTLCSVMGFFNGLVVAKLNIAPFIVTLSTMMGYRGICYLLTDGGITRRIANDLFVSISRSYFMGLIPIPAIILLLILTVTAWVLKNTSFGRTVYAVGGNSDAARMMGLSIQRVKILVYGISGLLSGLSGMLMASRMSSGEPVTGNGYEMNAISSVVLGAALLSGGKGNVVNTVFGAMVLGVLNNLLNMQGTMSAQVQNVVMGVLLLVIVIVQSSIKWTDGSQVDA
jgi:ribose transport system permease protein